MAFNDIINRTDAEALIPLEVSDEIIGAVEERSIILNHGRALPRMSRKQRELNIVNSLPHAYFLNGDTDLKQTTKMGWENKYITAEEVAVVVPIPDAVFDDSKFDIWAQIKPELVTAIGKAIDGAILYGTNKPASWPTAIVAGATAVGNTVVAGTGTSLFEDIMGESGVISKVEQSGYYVDRHIAAISMRGKLRGTVDSDGQPIFRRMNGMQESTSYEIDGAPIYFPRNGAMDPSKSLMISGDWTQLVYSIRQDITFRVFEEGVVTDATGAILYNLMQQDMKALRVVFRMGWQLPNPINHIQEDETKRYPFAVLTA